MTAEHYHALHSWMDAHPTAKRCVVALDRWLPLIPFVCYPVLLCLLNVRLFRLLGSQRQAALDLTAVIARTVFVPGLTFCYSGLAAVLPALSTDLFGLPHAGVNYGFLALGQSVGSLAFPFAANLWGLEAGRHWLAVGGAAAGFAAMWVLKPAGQTPRRQDTGA